MNTIDTETPTVTLRHCDYWDTGTHNGHWTLETVTLGHCHWGNWATGTLSKAFILEASDYS